MTLQLQPGNLDGFYAAASAQDGADRTMSLRDIWMAPDAVFACADFALAGRPPGCVLIVQDETAILRAGEPVKAMVAVLFAAAGCEVRVVVVRDPHEVHTTAEHIETVRASLEPGLVVIALGSGTITDITKHAIFGFEQQRPDAGIRLVVVQTANSVCAYTSGLAVVTTDGVKRTVPSRLPDGLLLDTTMLCQAPPAYTFGGVGDSSVAAVSFADYRLVHLLGMGRWEPLSWNLMAPSRSRFLASDPVLADRGDAGAGALAMDLAACGLAMTFAGESAPLSGLEHVTSHMLDMAADHYHRPVGNHGSQCALATVLTLIAYEKLINEVDLRTLDLDPERIDEATERRRVLDAFAHVDADGRAWQECWTDFHAKIGAWKQHRESVLGFVAAWPDHREDLRRYLVPPQAFIGALAATGHPLRFEAVPPGIDESQARWAFQNARLMRKRTNVADLLGFAGLWTDDFVDGIFSTFHALINPLESAMTRPSRTKTDRPAKELT